jgi:acyl-CoA thioester hydrolase
VSDLTVHTDVDVRFRDSDAMGHVNNAVYLTYLEVGRQAYWQRLDPARVYDAVPFVLARASIDFKHPARTGDTVRVGLGVHWMSRSAFGMRYRLTLRDAETLLAEAQTVQVTYDYAARKPMPIPAWLRERIEALEGPLPASATEER